jgi:hypothetical protein
MTRSILCGLLGLLSVATLATLPVACQSGGVGDPCTPEDEYNTDFAGFKMTEENIESRSFQCSTRICLVNHFQGRVSCPLGQDAPIKCNGPDDTATCTDGAKCVEASTLAPDCEKDADCASAPGTTCDKKRAICTCQPGSAAAPDGYFCVGNVYKSYVCHKPASGTKSNCQNEQSAEKDNLGKECCIPGTDTPVAAPVCGQCAADSKRNAEQAVYCSCRCGVAEGEPPDPNFNFCACPTGFTCSEIRKNVGLGDVQITGKYCIKEGTDFQGGALDCGDVKGHWDPTCRGTGSVASP